MRPVTFFAVNKYLQSSGYSCYSFEVRTQGNYLPVDAEWNYKDIPHLNHIHNLVDSGVTFADDHVVTSIITQNVPPFFKFPMTLVNYHVASDKIIYHSQFLFWVIVIETTFCFLDEINKAGCEVVTKYNLYGPRYLQWLCFFFKFVIKRNNKELMNEDVPMRNRRQELREAGFDFKVSMGEYHSYSKTLELDRQNVISPNLMGFVGKFDLKDIPEGDEGLLLGDSVGMGFRVVRSVKKDVLLIFSRVCDHYGADLSSARCQKGFLICPWHGKFVKPLATISTKGDDVSVLQKQAGVKLKVVGQAVSLYWEMKSEKRG